jgi:hypothetical protein
MLINYSIVKCPFSTFIIWHRLENRDIIYSSSKIRFIKLIKSRSTKKMIATFVPENIQNHGNKTKATGKDIKFVIVTTKKKHSRHYYPIVKCHVLELR